MDPNHRNGLASIIVPCWNQREFTRLCLQALFRFTRSPWELIVVDNGSTDDTAAYLAGVQDATTVPVTVVSNSQNLGFPAAINQGLQVARGEYLVLLNNDAVVTDGWLDQLLALTAVGTRTDDGERNRPQMMRMDTEGDSKSRIPDSRAIPERGISEEPTRPVLTILDYAEETATGESGQEQTTKGEGVGQTTRGIGLAGPMSNYAAPPQLVEPVPYRDLDEMHIFARRWREEHRGKWFTAGKLSGFCIVMTRAVYDAIGGLDERFGIGFFDDDDLAERARRAGFELAVAHDLFVHHFGSRTFVGNGIDAEALLDQNARRFADKWGQDMPQGRRVGLRPWPVREQPQMMRTDLGENALPQVPQTNPDADSRSQIPNSTDADSRSQIPNSTDVDSRSQIPNSIDADSRSQIPNSIDADSRSQIPNSRIPECDGPSANDLSPPIVSSSDLRSSAFRFGRESGIAGGSNRTKTFSLTMIVKDEEPNLPRCLGSVRGLFDEIVVVDTGSTDRTKEIAQEFGARVFDFAWVDDFSAARNEALSHATGDYAFWLDADDVVDPPQREKLEALIGRVRQGEETAYVVRCACDPSTDGSGGQTVVDHIRLFPLRDDVRWTYRVHEQILPALQQAGVPVRWSDLVVRHTGYTDPVIRAKKLDRDTRLSHKDLKDRPADPFVLFNLGGVAIERQEWRGALDYLRRSLTRSAPRDSITRKIFALIARAHQMLGESAVALRACAEGLSIDREDAELWFRKAVVHRHRGESAQAEACWRRILTLQRPERYASVDMGIYGHLTRRNLAMLAAERGDRAEVARLWAEVLAECPGDREAMAQVGPLNLAHPAVGR